MNRNPFQVGDQVRQAPGYLKLPESAIGEVIKSVDDRVEVAWKNGPWANTSGHYSYFEPAVRKGYRLTGSGFEVYDTKAHIKRAFEDLPIGASLNMKQIQDKGQRDDIPSSKSVLLSVIMVRVQALCEGRQSIEGLAGNYDDEGRCIVYKVMDEESMPKAINNPTVECCGRDVADCDCHPLAIMYAEARRKHGGPDCDMEEMAREVAIDLIVTSGYDSSDKDALGEPIGDTVQSLLMVALMRAPEIGSTLNGLLEANEKGGYTAPARKPDERYPITPPPMPTSEVDLTKLIIGRKYKVRYQIPGIDVTRECLVEYIGEDKVNEQLVFTGRRTFSTINIYKAWITSVEEGMFAGVECYVDKIVKP